MTNPPPRQTRAEALQADAQQQVEQLQQIIRQYENRDENCRIGAIGGGVIGGVLGFGVSLGGSKILGIGALARPYSVGTGTAAGAGIGCKIGEWLNVRTWGAAQASEAEPVRPLRTPEATAPTQPGQGTSMPR
jgi:hypothetical protein